MSPDFPSAPARHHPTRAAGRSSDGRPGRLRVLHLIDSFGPGGAQAFLVHVLPLLDPERFEILAVALHGDGPAAEALSKAGIACRSLAKHRPDPRIAFRLRREVAAFRPDILHAQLVISSLLAEWLPLPGRVCTVEHLQAQYRSPWRSALYQNALEPFCYRRCDAVVACAASVARSLAMARGEALLAGRLAVVPNAVPSAFLEPIQEEERQVVRRELGLNGDDSMPVLLSASRLIPLKNLEQGIDFAHALHRNGVRFHYLIAGDGPWRGRLEQRVRASGLEDVVRFLGHRSDMRRLYGVADLFVMPSRVEGLPLGLLEAMACGSVPVVTPFRGARAIVRDGRNGLVVPFGGWACEEFDQSVERIADLLHCPEKRETLARAARATVARKYTAERAARRLEALYGQLAGDTR